jgi:DNA polymerase IV (archaeal DinB-like DNA polymerase)
MITSMTGGEQRIILHLDMDSFYASVEIQKRPELAGQPVIIGADPKHGKGRGVVSTCSYKAREFGVRSAMPISQAYVLCPHAVFLPPDFPSYVKASSEVMAILRASGFPFEQVSIDEAFLDMTAAGGYIDAERFARESKEKIMAGLGLSCSIGIGPSKVVAKIASDFEKPDGLTMVPPERVQEFLAPMPVRKIPGIGQKSGMELLELGIKTIGDLARCDVQVLLARFGKGGLGLHNLALGIDGSDVVERGGPRSISRETTFEEDTGDPGILSGTMEELVEDVHRNLREENLRFMTVTVKVRYTGFVTKTKAKSVSHYTNDIAVIRRSGHSLLRELMTEQKIRLVGLRLSGFEERDSRQTTLDL